MALKPCAECGREVSDKATSCPQCGSPLFVERLNENLGGGIFSKFNCGCMLLVALAVLAFALAVPLLATAEGLQVVLDMEEHQRAIRRQMESVVRILLT